MALNPFAKALAKFISATKGSDQSVAKSSNLGAAKGAKQDEFYTQLTDIEKEMRYYRKHFKGKTILCNCDDPFESNFFKYFVLNFNKLGLKKLIATCYSGSSIAGTQLVLHDVLGGNADRSYKPYKAVVTKVYDTSGDGGVDMLDVAELFRTHENELVELDGNGDFRSDECLSLLDEADIVVTNPPFSLFREYVSVLVTHGKHFIIIGSQNAITYQEIFSLFRQNRVWLGYNSGDMSFTVPADYEPRETRYWQDETGQKWRSMGNICWYTNLDIKKRHEELIPVKRYDPQLYPKYVNYDAIEVSSVACIPCDYAGEMGVPITFLDKYNPEQFELVGISRELVRTVSDDVRKNGAYPQVGRFYLNLGGPKYKKVYERLVIKNRHPEPSKEV